MNPNRTASPALAKTCYLLSLTGLLYAIAPACSTRTPQAGSETHFLSNCTEQCGGGLECIDSVCTRFCGTSGDCTSLDAAATCVGSGETASCQLRCESNAECRAHEDSLSCNAGLCSPGTSPSGNGGFNDAGSAEDPDATATNGSASDASLMNPSQDLLSGIWKGYVENYQFTDDTDTMTLTISESSLSDGGPLLTGTLVVGELTPPPPATDPDVGYPDPPYTHTATDPMIVGVPYSIRNVQFDGRRLQFDLVTNELWTDWCALQTSIADQSNPGFYHCLPNWPTTEGGDDCSVTNPETREVTAVDCVKLELCKYGTCHCDADGCWASMGTLLHFDLVVTAPHIDGSFIYTRQPPRNVHLTKQ